MLVACAAAAAGCARKIGYGKDDVARQVGYLRQDVQALQEQCAALKEQQKALAAEVRSLGGEPPQRAEARVEAPPPAPAQPETPPSSAPPAPAPQAPQPPPPAPAPPEAARAAGGTAPAVLEQPAPPPSPPAPGLVPEASTPPAPRPEPTLRADETLPAPNDLYKEAFGTMQRGEITRAEVLFSEFVRVYPEHDLADNAQYWLGECFYGQKEYAHALNLFKHLVERFPQGNKVPDALYKQALCEKVLGRGDEAARTARRLREEYPTTEAAQKGMCLIK